MCSLHTEDVNKRNVIDFMHIRRKLASAVQVPFIPDCFSIQLLMFLRAHVPRLGIPVSIAQ